MFYSPHSACVLRENWIARKVSTEKGWEVGDWGVGGIGLLGTIAASPLKAISTGPQDMAALSPPAEKSSAGASHLSATQPRLKKIRFLLASRQHTHFYVQCVRAKQSNVFARRHGAAMDRHTWLPGIVVLVLSTVSPKKKKKTFFVSIPSWFIATGKTEMKKESSIDFSYFCVSTFFYNHKKPVKIVRNYKVTSIWMPLLLSFVIFLKQSNSNPELKCHCEYHQGGNWSLTTCYFHSVWVAGNNNSKNIGWTKVLSVTSPHLHPRFGSSRAYCFNDQVKKTVLVIVCGQESVTDRKEQTTICINQS